MARVTPEQLAKSGTETAHQQAFFCALTYEPLELVNEKQSTFSIPNGGERNVAVAARLKAEGVKKGVLDIFVAVPRGQYHGLWIEMKIEKHRNRQRGGMSPEQVEFGKVQLSLGYRVEVCYTWEEALNVWRDYVNAK